jgi:hypothetical protein
MREVRKLEHRKDLRDVLGRLSGLLVEAKQAA